MDVEHPVVATQYGPVRGVRKLAATGVDYYSFQRIPYVQPPVGELRFKVRVWGFDCGDLNEVLS